MSPGSSIPKDYILRKGSVICKGRAELVEIAPLHHCEAVRNVAKKFSEGGLKILCGAGVCVKFTEHTFSKLFIYEPFLLSIDKFLNSLKRTG